MKAILATGTAVVATLAAVLTGGAASAHPDQHFYTTKTPYAPQESRSNWKGATTCAAGDPARRRGIAPTMPICCRWLSPSTQPR